MNTVAKALELVEPYLATQRYWARVTTLKEYVFFEAGPLHANGFEECPTYTGIVREDGQIVHGGDPLLMARIADLEKRVAELAQSLQWERETRRY